MERAGNDFACLPLCSFLTLLWVKTKYFFSWAAGARDVHRHHTGIMCVLGLLTYPWGAQPCARVSPPLAISFPVKSNKVGVMWDKRGLFSVGWRSNTGRAAQELWKVTGGCGVPSAAPLWPREPQLWLTDHHWPTGSGTGEVSFRRFEIRFHRKVWWKVCNKSCSGWSHVQALSPSTACFYMWFLIPPWKVCINFLSQISRRKLS